MGWLITQGATKKDIIQDRIKGWENDNVKASAIAHCLRGNTLWIVIEIIYKKDVFPEVPTFRIVQPPPPIRKAGESFRFIECDLLRYDKGYGYGYKDMEESMGPYKWDCPLSYLKMVPVVGDQKWRDGVIEYHAKRNRKDNVEELKKNFALAQEGKGRCILHLIGSTVKSILVCSITPKVRGYDAENEYGKLYRIPRRFIGHSEVVTN